MHLPSRIIISRTDSLGDVVLTLPAAGILKQLYPSSYIYFLGRTYSKPLIKTCEYVDEFLNWDEISKLQDNDQVNYIKSLNCDTIIHVFPNKNISRLAWKSNIQCRIGTSHRLYNIFYCNYRIGLSRKTSDLHEVQLNLKLFTPLGITYNYSLDDIPKFYGLKKVSLLPSKYGNLLDKSKFNLILHPKSKGSAREWGLDNFSKLITLLPSDKYKIFISGTNDDKQLLLPFLETNKDKITDITGLMNLDEFLSFIASADGLVAASTGPLHIASALGKVAIGLYAPMLPIHPGRWSPVGTNASFLVINKNCDDCRKGGNCKCIIDITPQKVVSQLEALLCAKEF